MNTASVKSLLRDVYRAARSGPLAQARVRAAHGALSLGLDVRVLGDPARVRLGEHVTIAGPSTLDVSDGGGLTGALLEVGARTYVGEFANLRCGGAPIRIGADVLVAQNVTLVASGHGIEPGSPIASQPWHGDGIVVGDDVWIGAGVTVLPGVHVGDGAVLGSGAVVTKDVPAGAIVGGVPARVLRTRAEAARPREAR